MSPQTGRSSLVQAWGRARQTPLPSSRSCCGRVWKQKRPGLQRRPVKPAQGDPTARGRASGPCRRRVIDRLARRPRLAGVGKSVAVESADRAVDARAGLARNTGSHVVGVRLALHAADQARRAGEAAHAANGRTAGQRVAGRGWLGALGSHRKGRACQQQHQGEGGQEEGLGGTRKCSSLCFLVPGAQANRIARAGQLSARDVALRHAHCLCP